MLLGVAKVQGVSAAFQKPATDVAFIFFQGENYGGGGGGLLDYFKSL